MYGLLVRLMVVVALVQIGKVDWGSPLKTEAQLRGILRIDWKSISVFPKEAARFKQNRSFKK